jgi:hypothetical protein
MSLTEQSDLVKWITVKIGIGAESDMTGKRLWNFTEKHLNAITVNVIKDFVTFFYVLFEWSLSFDNVIK